MAVGLNNIQATFEADTNNCFHLYTHPFAVNYLDDVLIYLTNMKKYAGQI